ncbi:hypothetical protein Rsub_11526 [Raphidocelis subcapitata]|uniref:Uncharacterized protein n=1 Tax=Raphidocelis subcapitata TaxID=307507 RepID=A0A2V0PGA6_9CHLO|nr:hypothetical protein Rsub_11526 [Raphidocelis subcapitata]|eukprot:GBF98888.1 hypothetical protein Rsub_11526 [Raphidocelis subcapitata]
MAWKPSFAGRPIVPGRSDKEGHRDAVSEGRSEELPKPALTTYCRTNAAIARHWQKAPGSGQQAPGGEREAAARTRQACWVDSVHLEQLPGRYIPSWPGTPRDLEEKETEGRARGIPGYTGCSPQRHAPAKGAAAAGGEGGDVGGAGAPQEGPAAAAASAEAWAAAAQSSKRWDRQTAGAAAAAAAPQADGLTAAGQIPQQPHHNPPAGQPQERGPPSSAPQLQPQAQTQPRPRPTTYGAAFPGGPAYTLTGGWCERAARLPWDAHGTGSGGCGGCELPYSAVDTRFASYGGVRNSASNL